MLAPLPLLGGIFPVMPGALAFGPLPGMGAFSQVSVPPSPVRMLKSKAGVVPVVEVNGAWAVLGAACLRRRAAILP
jgi:hypothetical protein